jgi:2-octaprenyl-6-methoxyphenol hydroxylase
MFEALGVWDEVADEAQPILDMVVTDSRVHDAVRPVFLTFGGEIEPGEPFAHMIENDRLVAALSAKARSSGVTLVAASVADFAAETSCIGVVLDDRAATRTKLLVAADGARSRLRERAGIAINGWSYGQAAIVTTVAHERNHEGRAEEHFLPAGPFAILPLRHNRSSNGSLRYPTINFTASSRSGSACASGTLRSRGRATLIRSACGWRAASSPIGLPWSAMPRTSSTRSPGKD